MPRGVLSLRLAMPSSWVVFVPLLLISLAAVAISADDDIQLTVNVTLKGDICPAGIEFNCTVSDVESLVWYLENTTLVKFVPTNKEKHIRHLCENITNNEILEEFCGNGSSLWIESVRSDSLSRYDIISHLVTTGTYIGQNYYLFVLCGNESTQEMVSTDFNLSCNPVSLNLTYNNSHVEDEICEGEVEFTCTGNSVKFFQWTYNGRNLTEIFSYSVDYQYPHDLSAFLEDVNCIVLTADTNNSFAESFNIKSTCVGDLINLKAWNVSSIGCISNGGHSEAKITCELPSTMTTPTSITATSSSSTNPPQISTNPNRPSYLNYLSWVDFLPFCHVNNTTSLTQNGVCLSSVSVLILLAVLLCCIFCCGCFFPFFTRTWCLSKCGHSDEDTELICVVQNFGASVTQRKGCIRCCCCKNRMSLCSIVLLWCGYTCKHGYQPLPQTQQNPNNLDTSCAIEIEDGRERNIEEMRNGTAYESNTSDGKSYDKEDKKKKQVEKKKKQEEDSKRKQDEDNKRKQDEDNKRKQEEDNKKKQEDERKRKQEQEEKKRKQIEEEQIKIEEENTLQRERIENEQKRSRDEERTIQEKADKVRAEQSSRHFLLKKYKQTTDEEEMGSRLQKYWSSKGEKKHSRNILQFTAKVSKKCPVLIEDSATLETMNELFICLQHPYLLTVFGLTAGDENVSVVQKIILEGSLRDRMYKVDPFQDWSKKYRKDATAEPVHPHEVATCSRHILEALLVLYEAGFPAIGQIHTGNVFFEEGNFVLGGFENTLLGYRTCLYADIKSEGLLQRIDTIMLGHLVYEISSGEQLPEVLPSKSFKFEKVANAQIQNFLNFIFYEVTKKTPKKAVEKILNHSFVKDIPIAKVPRLEIPPKARNLLEDVSKYSSQTQATPITVTEPGFDIIQLAPAECSECTSIERIGWRSEKLWGRAQHGSWGQVLLSAAEVPRTCPIFVQNNMKEIEEILGVVKEHQHIHASCEIYCKQNDGTLRTVLIEPMKEGSLKDILYGCQEPLHRWENKYLKKPVVFKDQDIAIYGCQVLDALRYLYSLGFPPIGQVTTGNIFLVGNICQLGSFENVILGHRTESYALIKKIENIDIDVFMFGLVVLEMATGKAMKTLPGGQHYKKVSKEMKSVIEYIFRPKISVEEVQGHQFFCEYKMTGKLQCQSLSKSARVLLQKVRKGKWRTQDNRGEKLKDKLRLNLFRERV